MNDPFGPQSRRTFLARSAAIPALGGALSAPLSAETTDDYRAIVCIMLEGGMDNWNALVPYDTGNYAAYRNVRDTMAVDRGLAAATALQPNHDLGGFAYALHPQMRNLATMFHNGDAAVIQGLGALVEPTSRARFLSGAARVPPQLCSHDSQRAYVLSGLAEGGNSGWGGRLADAVSSRNARREFTCINAAGANSIFLYGNSTLPYSVGAEGPVQLLRGKPDAFGASAADLLRVVSTTAEGNMFRAEYANLMRRALDASGTMSATFAGVGDDQTPELSDPGNELAMQLRSVAKVIRGARGLGMRRQVFYTMFRGWDSHKTPLAGQAELFGKLDAALAGFHLALQRWGMADAVTTFTASDFGRGLVSNGDGSDHGWGGVGFVTGGAVSGRRIIGTPPVVGIETQNTVMHGRLLPNVAIDQLAATLASWMGVATGDLSRVVPNIVNFDPKVWDLKLFS